MINLFTTHLKQVNTINDNDNFFFQNISPQNINAEAKLVMKQIDNAELLDASTGKIQTPRGIGSIEDLSTGCKTVLNYIFVRDNNVDIQAINVSYCGYNAVDVLFDIAEKDNSDFAFILMHRDGIYKCKEHDYFIDSKRHISSLLDL